MTDGDLKAPEIVIMAHRDLERVKALLAEDPSLLNIMYDPWKETPLGAASHVGNRQIAEYLLAQGAPLTITTAAMLGRGDDVKQFLTEDPELANATGAHDISLLFHAALSGEVELVEMITAHGGRTDTASHALQAAVQSGHLAMARWLLGKGADPNSTNFQGETPLAIAKAIKNSELAALLEAHGGRERV